MTENYGINMQGIFQAESIATLPAWTSNDERRWIYAEDTKKCYFGTDTGWEEFGSGLSTTGSASIGPSYWFDGTNDYIEVPDDIDIDFGTDGDFSIEMVVKPYNVTDTGIFLLNKEAVGVGYGLKINEDDLQIRIDDDSTDPSGTISTVSFTANTVTRLIVTFDRVGNAIAYINGTSAGTVDISGVTNTISSGGVLRIGTESGGTTNAFSGEIIYVRIYNRVLTTTEVSALTSGIPVPFKYVGANNTELVTDGTMESNPTGNWIAYDTASIATETGTKHGGSNSLKVTRGASNGKAYQSVGNLTVGKEYNIRAWAYIPTAGNADDATIQARYGNTFPGTNITLTGTITTTTKDSWVKLEGTFVCTSALAHYISLDVGDDSTDYVFFDDVSQFQSGCVLNLENSNIGHNQWLDTSGNELHGEVNGPLPINLNSNHVEKVIKSTITSDTTWTDIVPAGYILERIVFEETAGNAAILSLGTSDGAYDVFTNVTMAASSITVVDVGELYSKSTAQTLDLNDDQTSDDWNSASVNVTIIMVKV